MHRAHTSESYKSRMTTAMYRQGGQEFIVVIFCKNAKTWVPAHDPEPNLSVTLLLRACALRRRRALAQHGTTWATSSYPPRQIGPAWPFQLQCCIHHACSDNGRWTRLHAHRAAQLRRRSADRIRLALASRSTAGTLRLTSLSTILIDAMEKSN